MISMSGKDLNSVYSKGMSSDIDRGFAGITKGEKALGFKRKTSPEERLKQ